jgi:drug/metabolite transporter (DMT)-like permease
MKKLYLGYLLTVLSAFAFASMSLFMKIGYDMGMTAFSFSLIQSAFALVLLLGMLARESRAPGRRAGPQLRSQLPGLLGFVLCGAVAAIAFNVALVSLSISLGTILLFTYPAFTALGAWAILRQRPSAQHIIALAMTLAGALLTANIQQIRSGQSSFLGIGLALLAAVAQGLYITLGEQVAASLTAVQATTYTRVAILLGAVVLSPGVFAAAAHTPWQGWALGAVAATVAGVAPFFFLNRGIALIGANRAAIASVAELPIALSLGKLFQGDLISPWQWAGAALIVSAVLVSQQEPTHTKEEKPV